MCFRKSDWGANWLWPSDCVYSLVSLNCVISFRGLLEYWRSGEAGNCSVSFIYINNWQFYWFLWAIWMHSKCFRFNVFKDVFFCFLKEIIVISLDVISEDFLCRFSIIQRGFLDWKQWEDNGFYLSENCETTWNLWPKCWLREVVLQSELVI